MNDKNIPAQGYGIGAVARMTGLSTHTLRMWERRYQAVVAERAPNGRRSYRPEDVEKLSLLKSLTDQGTSIGSIANLTTEALRERAGQMEQIRLAPFAGEIKVAVFGVTLPALLEGPAAGDHPFTLVARGSDPRQFRADLRQQIPDVLVLEASGLDSESMAMINDLSKSGRGASVVIAYDFARSGDEQAALARGFRLLRTPVASDELVMAITAAAHDTARGPAARPATDPGLEISHESIPARLFTPQQLLQLSNVQTGIDCECPRHLSEIVRTISAFETYSQECEDRNADDAALHAHLRLSSARARHVMEEALMKLLQVENISI